MRKIYFNAVLILGFLLTVPKTGFAQSLDEAAALNQQVVQLYNRGRYSEAMPLAQRALAIQEKALGPNHPSVANLLSNLAFLYINQGRYAEAEPLYKRSLAIREKALGSDHPDVAASLGNLAQLYKDQGRYADAEPLFKRSLTIREKALGPDHPDVAASLNALASLYQHQGRYADAEPLYKRSLAIDEKALGSDHPDVALLLNNLALLYQVQGRYADAEPLYQRALAINEKALSPDHPNVALLLNNLALLYQVQGRYADAEPLYQQTLAIKEKALGPNNPDVALSLNNLALLYQVQGRYADAEPLYKRSLAIKEKALGPDHPDVAGSLNNLAELYRAEGRYAEAEPLYQRVLAINEKALGPDHPDVAVSLNNLAELYRAEGRYAEAEPLYQRSLTIREKALGPDHPDVAGSLNNLADLYRVQGRYADSEPLYKRSLTLWEKALGPDHINVAASLNNLALLYQAQGRYADAEALYKRSLAIKEKALGPDHPDVALSLNNLALLYQNQGRYADAESLFKRSLAVREKALGPDHPDVAGSLNNLAALYQVQGRYADALSVVQKVIAQNNANKLIAFGVLYQSSSQNLISPTEALTSSYDVLQRSASSAAGNAISLLAARFAAGSNELAQLVRKDQDFTTEAERLNNNIIDAVSKPPAERNAATEEQIRKRIEELKLQRDKLRNVFNQRFPGYVALSKPQPLSLQETQVLLGDDEALIIIDLDKKSYAWIVTKNRAEWKQLSVNAEDVSKAVAILRVALDPEFPKPFDLAAAYQLYQQVLGPIKEFISEKTRLSFVLNGALTGLPPQVLITSNPEGKDLSSVDWLVRKYALTVLPSVASLKILRTDKDVVVTAKPMIGFGDPVFDRTAQTAARKQQVVGFNLSLTSFYRGVTADTNALAEALPALPETADELRAVAKELGAKSDDIKLGEAASVTDVKHERLDNYRIVYFATHALVAGEVEKFAKVKAEPALVLSIPRRPSDEDDGLLRASDVAMLKMNADFVVLSACNTAAGDKPGAEALSGLARAFFYAGARSLIVSNWAVDSESTVALMTGLFDVLKSNPHLSYAEALRASMLQMIGNSSKPEWAQPKFWAPFIVVGEPERR
jgi:CHAT domain-containing protein/Tfp pilus assembly protein PilF